MNFTINTLAASLLFLTLTIFLIRFNYSRFFAQTASLPLSDKLMNLLISPLALTVFCLYGSKMLRTVGEERNWMRLASTFALFKGLPVYSGPDTGPAIATMYGPVSILAYWPATLAWTAPLMVQTAAFCAIFFLLAPIWLFCTTKSDSALSCKKFGTLLFLCIACIPLLVTSLKDVFFVVHADAPTLGLSALAGGFLYIFHKKNIDAGLILSALCAALAIWSKQVIIPILLPLCLFVLIQHGFKSAAKYTVWLLVFIGLVTGLMFYFFDPKDLYFNMVYLPSRHSLRELNIGSFFQYLWKILRECLIPLCSLVLFFIVYKRAGSNPSGNTAITKQSWTVFLWVTVIMLPITFYIHLKEGASNNTFAYSNYFFLIAAGLFLRELSLHKETEKSAKWILVAAGAALLTIMIPNVIYRTLQNTDYLKDTKRAYEFNLKHPDQVYYPRMTLINFLVDGKIYHSIDGIRDRNWAGLPLSDRHFRDDLPSKIKYIGFAKENYMSLIPLPEFDRETLNEPGMEGLSVFTRENDR